MRSPAEPAIPPGARADGREAPNIALMHLLSRASDEAAARHALDEAIARETSDSAERRQLVQIAALWRKHPRAYETVHRMLALANSGSDWRRIFDEAARLSPEAGVALYSLGDARLLSEATGELVELMREWSLLERNGRVLDLGCGTGRVAAAVAPLVGFVVALDVSPEMARLAQARTHDSANVGVVVSSGTDLGILADGSFDLVLAIDSFPYLVASNCAALHVAESARVLKRGGWLLIMNWSYRGDPGRDANDIAALAPSRGFAVRRNGIAPLSLWDGRAFLLEKT